MKCLLIQSSLRGSLARIVILGGTVFGFGAGSLVESKVQAGGPIINWLFGPRTPAPVPVGPPQYLSANPSLNPAANYPSSIPQGYPSSSGIAYPGMQTPTSAGYGNYSNYSVPAPYPNQTPYPKPLS